MAMNSSTLQMSPLPLRRALPGLVRCAGTTAYLLANRRLHQPTGHVGRRVRFADGTTGLVYRETVADHVAAAEPVVLVVVFRLRGVRGRGHALFRAESLLNTPLFAGFPGFISKLWMAADERGRYRGFYQWDGARAAEQYVGALWWVLALVSHRASIRYRVVPGVWRDDLLASPDRVRAGAWAPGDDWCRPVEVQPAAR
jgi:hypothetical protein